LRRVLTPRMVMGLARRRTQRRLRALFGGAVVKSSGAPFRLEAVNDVLIEGDPGGGACALVTGLSQAILESYGRDGARVEHPECQGRGHLRCLWTIADDSSSEGSRRSPVASRRPDPN
jgi:hypothetical protein